MCETTLSDTETIKISKPKGKYFIDQRGNNKKPNERGAQDITEAKTKNIWMGSWKADEKDFGAKVLKDE